MTQREELAYKIQEVLADELWADGGYDINGVGHASFKIADIALVARAEAHERGIEAAIEKFQDQTGGFGEDDDDQVIRLVIAAYQAALSAKETAEKNFGNEVVSRFKAALPLEGER